MGHFFIAEMQARSFTFQQICIQRNEGFPKDWGNIKLIFSYRQ